MPWRYSLIILVLLVLSGHESAHTDVIHGTAIAFGSTHELFVMSADSRVLDIRGVANDHSCKIVALGKTVVFSQAGIQLLSMANNNARWNAYESAKSLVDKYGVQDKESFAHVVGEFSRTLRAELELVRKKQPDLYRTIVKRDIGESGGTFAAYIPDKGILVGTVDLVFKDDGTYDLRPGLMTAGSMVGATGVAVRVLAALGDHHSKEDQWIVDAFGQKDPHWSPAQYEKFTNRIVELSKVEYPEIVAGDTDQVELTKDGVHWLRRKPGCASL